MASSLQKARVCAKLTRLEGKSVTALDVVRLADKNKRAAERDRYFAERRKLVELMNAQISETERGQLATRCQDGKAYGWNELHAAKRHALPMQSHLWV